MLEQNSISFRKLSSFLLFAQLQCFCFIKLPGVMSINFCNIGRGEREGERFWQRVGIKS